MGPYPRPDRQKCAERDGGHGARATLTVGPVYVKTEKDLDLVRGFLSNPSGCSRSGMRQELAKEGLYGDLETLGLILKRSDLALIPVLSAGANCCVWGTEHQLRDRQFERRPSVSMAAWSPPSLPRSPSP